MEMEALYTVAIISLLKWLDFGAIWGYKAHADDMDYDG